MIYRYLVAGIINLESIDLPQSLNSIEEYAFINTLLKNVVIPDSVSYIGKFAFYRCPTLKEIVILNPDCEIYDADTTITSMDSFGYRGVIKGYKGSTAEVYANKYGYTFVPLDNDEQTITITTTSSSNTHTSTTPTTSKKVVYGDVNIDGKVTVADAVAILQFLGNKDKYALTDEAKANADCYNTGDVITGNDALTIQKIDAGLINASNLPYMN